MKKSIRILHLEDNPQDAELVYAKLEEGDFEFETVRVDNREDFVREIRTKKFNLILADRTTPTFDGLSALQISHEELPDIPFIFVTGTLDEEVAISTLKSGARDYVLKHRLSRLLPAVVRAIGEIESEQKQKLLEKQLIESQKMEGLGRLAGGIAHDFNNILAIIQCNASIIGKPQVTSAELESISSTISQAVSRGAQLVRQLLTFAKKTETSYQQIDLNRMIEDLVNMLQSAFPKNILFHKKLTAGIPQLYADVSQIHQILLNLCVNARDAMPDGGSITISTKNTAHEELLPHHPESKHPTYITVSVRDTGTGMDQAILQKIFDPFFTTKEKGKGTGLGLSVAYGIVQNHQGIIEVESRVGLGTTFHIHLPILSFHAVDAGEQVAPQLPMRTSGTETILLVEDEVMLLQIEKHSLEAEGYRVLSAKDGDEAVKLFTKNHRKIDIVLSDYGLPKLDGFQLFLKLKEIQPDVKLILISGFLEPAEKKRMQEAGICDFISKPCMNKNLLLKLRSILDRPKT